jgi:hypothetical protein
MELTECVNFGHSDCILRLVCYAVVLKDTNR